MSYLKQYVFLSNLIPFLKKSVKKWDSAGQKTISGSGAKGGLKKNGLPQIIISLKPFKANFMSWDQRSWVNESIPTFEIKIKIFIVWKMIFLIDFRGAHHIFLSMAVQPPPYM